MLTCPFSPLSNPVWPDGDVCAAKIGKENRKQRNPNKKN